MGMKTLDQIAIEQQTDKATVFTRTYAKPKGYTPHYAEAFDRIRHDPIKLLEIGVGGGESIRMWLEYFHNAKVFGVDNVQATNPWNTVVQKPDPRYTFVHGDQGDETFWKCFVADYGSDWGVIVDDGSHISKDVITTHKMLWPRVAAGGLYAIEDLGVAFGVGSVFLTPGWPGHMALIRDQIEALHRGTSDVDSIHFSKELAIFRKEKA